MIFGCASDISDIHNSWEQLKVNMQYYISLAPRAFMLMQLELWEGWERWWKLLWYQPIRPQKRLVGLWHVQLPPQLKRPSKFSFLDPHPCQNDMTRCRLNRNKSYRNAFVCFRIWLGGPLRIAKSCNVSATPILDFSLFPTNSGFVER